MTYIRIIYMLSIVLRYMCAHNIVYNKLHQLEFTIWWVLSDMHNYQINHCYNQETEYLYPPQKPSHGHLQSVFLLLPAPDNFWLAYCQYRFTRIIWDLWEKKPSSPNTRQLSYNEQILMQIYQNWVKKREHLNGTIINR